MKLNNQISSFTIFLNYKKEHMKNKLLFLPYQKIIWNPLELDKNMQLNNYKYCLKKTWVPEFLTRPSYL